MSSGIHEAAERLRRTSVSDPMYNNAHDQALLAAEMLRLLNPAPFTAEALEARGFEVLGGNFLLRGVDHVQVSQDLNRVYVNGMVLRSITTLGALDALLFALKGEGK